MQTWNPRNGDNAIDGRSIALEVAQRVQQLVMRDVEGPYDPSLACGDAGLAVLFGYLDKCFPDANWDKIAHKAVLRISRNISSSSDLPIGFFGGLAGWAFATWYLSRDGSRYGRAQSALEDELFPRAVVKAKSLAAKTGMAVEDYDLVSGLSGVAAYLLCRFTDNRAYGALRTVIESLVEIVERKGATPAWFTPAELISAKDMIGKYPDGNLNCGLAHGMPGMLSVLALALRRNIAVPGLRSAVERSSYWLKAQRLPDTWGGSWPPAVAIGRLASVVRAPVAWCYGNPGIARALWLAGTAIDDSSLCETAIEAIRAVCGRHRLARSVSSPTFCHGVAGLLQITMRFASETALPEFSDLADTFLDRLLRSFSADFPFGYRAYDSEAGFVDRPGLLDGAAGVALVLLAAASHQEPTWDRIFLSS